ncbi:MAG TPA: ABC transporter permease [Phototrophicaceae bacterium]|nr:ABC transporter permease [Phototrophicaceae bacterium]
MAYTLNLLRFAAGRFASAVLTLLLISILVFTAIHLIPGSYEDVMLGPQSTPAARERLREKYGLDDPLPTQYVHWLLSALGGDMGVELCLSQQSIGQEACQNADQTQIVAEYARRAPTTIELAIMAVGFSLLIGLPLGVFAGLNAASRIGRGLSRAISALAMSVPDFVLGTLLVYVFSRYPLVLTVGGFVPFFDDPITNLRAMILPALTLSFFGVAFYARTTRDAVLTVMSEPFITAAVARGESPAQIVRDHVLRNAAIPVVTVIGVNFGYLLSGAVIVEQLFSVPGFGRYILLAIQNRDYAVVQAGVMLAAVAFVCVNVVTDLIYAVIDPRTLRRGKG